MEYTIYDFLPENTKFKKILTGSELLLAHELDKYVRLLLGGTFTLRGISMARELENSIYFSYVVRNGLDMGYSINHEMLVELPTSKSYFFPGTVESVKLAVDTPTEVVYTFDTDIYANSILHGGDRPPAYVSLIAYLMVRSKMNNQPLPRVTIGSPSYVYTELEYVHLLVLQNYGNKLLSDWVTIHYESTRTSQPDWDAFLMYHRQLGYMSEEGYTASQKYKYLRNKFEPGDVVLRYTRSKTAKGRITSTLSHLAPAVIESFDKDKIVISYYPVSQTRLTRAMALDEIQDDLEDMETDTVITDDDYVKFQTSRESYNLQDIGIDMYTGDESVFLLRIHDSMEVDGTTQHLVTPEGTVEMFLPTSETIYAVFEDRGVKYNKERFLKARFPRKQPIYEMYRQQIAEQELQKLVDDQDKEI